MGKHTVNARHPMALQAELKAKMAAQGENPAPAAPPPPLAPVAPTPPPVAPAELTLKEKLDTLPDEELLLLASDNGLEEIADRDELVNALVAAEVTV